MKIRELFEFQRNTVTVPGNVLGPTQAGARPSGDVPTPNTETFPKTSNTPKTDQPTGFAPSTAAPTAATTQPQQPMGQPTSQPVQQNPQAPQGQQVTQDQAGGDEADSPATVQDLQDQFQTLMAKLRQIQQQEPEPDTLSSQPGVSG